jgi:serine/threonine protein kinase/Tol biopolymer transport system component
VYTPGIVKLRSGMVLEQYEILAPVGAGGMGEVYRARDTRLGREVAIKVLPELSTTDTERLRRFEQEARAAASLNHPNIFAIYELGIHDGVPYLVSELLEGETLRVRLAHGPLSLRKAVDYAIQIAHGLAAAHEKGIVHRDLKPENLFVTKDGRVKILDFGLARIAHQNAFATSKGTVATLSESGMVVGTVGYMSPEQVRGEPADHRSDIFAFGLVLYEMVTGERTFRKPTSVETMTAILNEEPPPISQYVTKSSAGLQRVVHRCLEKNPEQRFQSASDLAFAIESLSDSGLMPSISGGEPIRETPRRTPVIEIAAAALLLAVVVGYFVLRPAAPPKVSNYVQLTRDGRQKFLIGTDGARLYLNITGDFAGTAVIPVTGGEPSRIPMASSGMFPADLSPDGSDLLVIDGVGVPPKGSLWKIPVIGGVPRRLGENIVAEIASYSPDGKIIAYSNSADLFLANADGSGSHKITNIGSEIGAIVWSPDGQSLRLDKVQGTLGTAQIWEVGIDGSGAHLILPGWHEQTGECCGRWTPDGKFFVFQAGNQIWSIPRRSGIFGGKPQPAQLTSSPLTLSAPLFSRDGKKLFVIGQLFRGESVRFDTNSKQFTPFFNGISAEFFDFSADKQWVAYVTYPAGELWRSKVDGSERLQLTYEPTHAMLPRWSPDGKQIIFFDAAAAGMQSKIYSVPAEGGAVHPLLPDDKSTQLDATWSPDGTRIVFGGDHLDASTAIRILDVRTGKLSEVPDSQHLYSPRWSPDGRHIAAFPADSRFIMIFDVDSKKWTQLAEGSFGWLTWNHDGTYIYCIDFRGKSSVVRVRISDHHLEQVVDLKNLNITGRFGGSLSLAPDDSPLLLREAGGQDVYSVDFETK